VGSSGSRRVWLLVVWVFGVPVASLVSWRYREPAPAAGNGGRDVVGQKRPCRSSRFRPLCSSTRWALGCQSAGPLVSSFLTCSEPPVCSFLQSGPAGRRAHWSGGCLGRTRREFAPSHSEGFSFRGGKRGGGPAGRRGPALKWPSLIGGDCKSFGGTGWANARNNWLRATQVPVGNAEKRARRASSKAKKNAAASPRPQ
jgi:hypothetical protein